MALTAPRFSMKGLVDGRAYELDIATPGTTVLPDGALAGVNAAGALIEAVATNFIGVITRGNFTAVSVNAGGGYAIDANIDKAVIERRGTRWLPVTGADPDAGTLVSAADNEEVQVAIATHQPVGRVIEIDAVPTPSMVHVDLEDRFDVV